MLHAKDWYSEYIHCRTIELFQTVVSSFIWIHKSLPPNEIGHSFCSQDMLSFLQNIFDVLWMSSKAVTFLLPSVISSPTDSTICMYVCTFYLLPYPFLHQMIKPPLFHGEVQQQALHCFLLPDGRETGDSLPAEGYIFVTSYRVMFIGTPCDPSVRNSVVIQTMPLASLYQIKEMTAGPFSYPTQGLTVTSGIQMRALSGQASATWCNKQPTLCMQSFALRLWSNE